jgi:hypothetical protein
MAYFLRFDNSIGGNRAVNFTAVPTAGASGSKNFRWVFDFEMQGTNAPFAYNDPFNASLLIFFTSSTNLQIRNISSTQSITLNTAVTTRTVIEIVGNSGTISVIQDGVSVGTIFPTTDILFDIGGFGRNGSATRDFDLYRAEFYDGGVLVHDFDPSATSGIGSILEDVVGTNDGTLADFPTDNSQWVFYAAAGINIDVGFIISSASVFTPEVLTEIVIDAELVSGTETVYTAEVVAERLIDVPLINATTLVYSFTTLVAQAIEVPRVEATTTVYVPTIPDGILIDVPLVLSEQNVFTYEVVAGVQDIQPAFINSVTEVFLSEVVSPQFLDMGLVFATTGFYNFLVFDEDGFLVPVESRATFHSMSVYLRTQGFVGTNNDVIKMWLYSEGYTSQINDSFMSYWGAQGYSGAFNDRWDKWKRD